MTTGTYESASKPSRRCKEVEINGIILNDFMSSDNLNECVSALLRKEKLVLSKNTLKKVIRYNPTGKEKEKRKRFRKNKDQFAQLQILYNKCVNWDKPAIKRMAKELGLKES